MPNIWSALNSQESLEFTKGSCIDFTLTFKDADNNPLDLTGYTFEVYEGSVAAFNNGEVTADDDPTTGIITFHLESEFAGALERDEDYWVDISKIDPSLHVENTGRIPLRIT